MEFTFSEEEEAAREAARAVLERAAPDAVPSPAEPEPVAADFDRALWRKLAASGLTGLVVGTGHGGAGLGTVALCLALREAGRVLARVPLLETAATALTLREHAPRALAGRLLPKIADGTTAVTVACAGATGHVAPETAVEARPDGSGGLLLDGVQTAVPWAGTADLILVPARTAPGRPVLALLDPHAPGLGHEPQVATNGEPHALLRLDGVRAAAGRTVEDPAAADTLRRVLIAGTCAQALGTGDRALEMTAEHAAERRQFGHPLATFQAVAMQAADRWIDLRAAEATLWHAARTGDAADLAVAKIWSCEAVRRTAQTAQHLHGGLGADTEHPLHRYHAWAKQLEIRLGAAAAHEEELGLLLAARAAG